jgi:hypothetical protein
LPKKLELVISNKSPSKHPAENRRGPKLPAHQQAAVEAFRRQLYLAEIGGGGLKAVDVSRPRVDCGSTSNIEYLADRRKGVSEDIRRLRLKLGDFLFDLLSAETQGLTTKEIGAKLGRQSNWEIQQLGAVLGEARELLAEHYGFAPARMKLAA